MVVSRSSLWRPELSKRLKRARPGERLKVSPDETFTVVWTDHALSGYEMTVKVPKSIDRVEVARTQGKKMGATATVSERFRCRERGVHQIVFAEGRPWEDQKQQSAVTVECG